MKKLPLLLLTLLGCSPDSGQQVRYYDTAVVQYVEHTPSHKEQRTELHPFYVPGAIQISHTKDSLLPYMTIEEVVIPQRCAISLSCRSHGSFEHVVTGDAADSMRESLKQGATVGVSCTPYQRLGYGTQIRHEILLKP